MFLGSANFQQQIGKKSIMLILLSSIGISASLLFVFINTDQVLAYDDGVPKALILDQLYNEMPNEHFQNTAKEYLETAGYEVDIINTDDITVEFYKNLPTMDYKFVVVRSHGVADESNHNEVGLFTGEKYSTDSYILEQLSGTVKKGTPLLDLTFKPSAQESTNWIKTDANQYELTSKVEIIDNSQDEFFVISSKFINESMNGYFSNTIFFLGGCETLAEPSFAKSLIDREASLVVGWDRPISANDNDKIMLRFLQHFLVDKNDIEQAIDLAQFIPIENMHYPSSLSYYTNLNS
ncbi:MAG: hypothetical protein ACREAK_05605 [Nitrosarchaeum sp.]